MTPAELVAWAREKGVREMAVTDHDVLEGSREACALSTPELVVRPGVELDCLHEGRHWHVLGYDFCFDDAALQGVAARARMALEGMSEALIVRLGLAIEAYHAFVQPEHAGGWKGLHFLLHCGAAADMEQAMMMYPRNGIRYSDAPFPALAEVMAALRGAGGVAVLAHPGESAKGQDVLALVAGLVPWLDGVEVDYPSHGPELRRVLRELCAVHGLWATRGSDFHGAFTQGAPKELLV